MSKFDLGRPHLKIGAFGTGNLGDDLMLQAILQEEPNSIIVAYGKPRLPFNVSYISHDEFISAPAKFIQEVGALDFGGGNLFWSAENIVEMLVLTQEAKRLGIPVNLTRVGLQGFEASENYARMLLRLVDTISLRESDSMDICTRLLDRSDCRLMRDYVFEIARSSNTQLDGQITKVGINFADRRIASDEGFRNHILGIFSELARKFDGQLEFYYIPFCIHAFHAPENDAVLGDHFWNASNGKIKYFDSINTTTSLLKAADAMDILIGDRFHLQVVGYALDKFVIPIAPNLRSKYVAIAKEHNVSPIFLEHSQAFVRYQVEQRLHRFIENCNELGTQHDLAS